MCRITIKRNAYVLALSHVYSSLLKWALKKNPKKPKAPGKTLPQEVEALPLHGDPGDVCPPSSPVTLQIVQRPHPVTGREM